MKYQLLSLALFIAAYSNAQDDSLGNFISHNLSVSWKKKFDDTCSFQQLVNAVKRSNTLSNIDTFDNTITGQSLESFMDYRGAGYTAIGTPSYLGTSSFKSSVLIEHEKNGYTVTATKMIFINQNDTKSASPLFGSAQGETTSMEVIAIKKSGEFKSNFSKLDAKIIDYSLNKLYNFRGSN